MILWVDAHISPKLCPWIRRQFALDAVHVRDLGLREAEDPEIFDRARQAQAPMAAVALPPGTQLCWHWLQTVPGWAAQSESVLQPGMQKPPLAP